METVYYNYIGQLPFSNSPEPEPKVAAAAHNEAASTPFYAEVIKKPKNKPPPPLPTKSFQDCTAIPHDQLYMDDVRAATTPPLSSPLALYHSTEQQYGEVVTLQPPPPPPLAVDVGDYTPPPLQPQMFDLSDL